MNKKITTYQIVCLLVAFTISFLIAGCDLVSHVVNSTIDHPPAEIEEEQNEPAIQLIEIKIEKTSQTIQGGHELIDITYEAGNEKELGGFDMLIAFNALHLTFVGALEGSVYASCKWEYFTYRYGANGNCDGGCPSGLLRIVGIAETNNGANHPTCYTMIPGDTFATLDFLVTDDRTMECQYTPIRFFWQDCGDNTISSRHGDTLFVSREVIDFDEIGTITDREFGYPTYQGAQDEDCFSGNQNKLTVRFIDFYNGGIDIKCRESIDARGDINLNGISYEIADAVMFSNYFVYGLSVFNINLQGQIAVSDVNRDGNPLTISDFVYFARIMIGDSLSINEISDTLSANYAHLSNGDLILQDDFEYGAAYIVVSGNPKPPTLLATNMEMKYNFDGTNTHILIYILGEAESFSGHFINIKSDIVSIEIATYEGRAVSLTRIVP